MVLSTESCTRRPSAILVGTYEDEDVIYGPASTTTRIGHPNDRTTGICRGGADDVDTGAEVRRGLLCIYAVSSALARKRRAPVL